MQGCGSGLRLCFSLNGINLGKTHCKTKVEGIGKLTPFAPVRTEDKVVFSHFLLSFHGKSRRGFRYLLNQIIIDVLLLLF